MLHAKVQDHRTSGYGEDFKGFDHIIIGQAVSEEKIFENGERRRRRQQRQQRRRSIDIL